MAGTDYGIFDTTSKKDEEKYGPFATQAAPSRIDDIATAAKIGGVSAVQGIVGLANLASGGEAGRALQSTGVDLNARQEELQQQYSPEMQQQSQEVDQAEGFFPTVAAAVTKPRYLVNKVVESVPSMVASGVVGRGVQAAGAGRALAAGVGEGVITAGQDAEQIRSDSPDQTLSPKGAIAAVASGAFTAAVGAGGQKLDDALGVWNPNSLFLKGARKATDDKLFSPTRIVKGVGIEAGEEALQSGGEQMAINAAENKPLMQGVAEQAGQGAAVGGAMGGFGGLVPGERHAHAVTPQEQQNDPSITAPVGALSAAVEVAKASGALPSDQSPGEAAAPAKAQKYGGTRGLIAEAAKARGVDPITALVVSSIETGGRFNADAANPRSSARGMFQFMDATRKLYPQITPEQWQDPKVQAELGIDQLVKRNAAMQRWLGRDPTPAEASMGSVFGAYGASQILSADPNTPVQDVIASYDPKRAAQIASGNGIKGLTVGQTIDRWNAMAQRAQERLGVEQQAFPFSTQEAAQMRARAASNEGQMLEVVEHPNVPGRFAALPPMEGDPNEAQPASKVPLIADLPRYDENPNGTQAPEAVQAEAQGQQAAVAAAPAAAAPVADGQVQGEAAAQPLAPAAVEAAPAAQAAAAPAVVPAEGVAAQPGNPQIAQPAAPVDERTLTPGFDATKHVGIDEGGKPFSEDKAKAGNYQKGHEVFEGVPLSIENRIGSIRQGTAPDGTTWQTKMTEAEYGYAKRTRGADSVPGGKPEQVDVYLAKERTPNAPVYVFDQVDPESNQFDEHKAVMGAATQERAQQVYDSGFSDQSGPLRRAVVTEMSVPEFKAWLQGGTAETTPASVTAPTVREQQAVKDGVMPQQADLIEPAQGLFADAKAAQQFADANNLAATPLQTTEGYALAPKQQTQWTPQFAKDEAPRLANLNRALGYDDAAAITPLRNAPTPDAALAAHIADVAFGTKVVHVNANPEFDGAYFGNRVYLAANEEYPAVAITGHEVAHAFEGTELGRRLQDIFAQFGANSDEQVSQRQQKESDLSGQPVSEQYARNEVVADMNGSMWLDTNFWREIAARDDSLFRKVAYKFMELATKLVRVAQGSRFDASRIVSDVAAARSAIAQAWADRNMGKLQAQPQPSAGVVTSPTLSAASQPVLGEQRDRNLAKFLEGSVVQQPMYHGTTQSKMSEGVRVLKPGEERGDIAVFNPGSHFGTANIGNEFADGQPQQGGHVYPVYLSIKNPLRIEDTGAHHDSSDLRAAVAKSLGVSPTGSWQGLLASHGYDGIVYLNRREGYGRSGVDWAARVLEGKGMTDDQFRQRFSATDSYIPIHASQVKSVTGNIGTFDRENSDIRFSRKAVDNAVRVIVGSKPGEFDWHFSNNKAAPPFAAPVQGIEPRIEKIGPAVQKLLSAKPVSELAQRLGIEGLKVYPVQGTWLGKPEASFVLSGENMNFQRADLLSRMLGFAFAQDATVVTQPMQQGKDFVVGVQVGADKKLNAKQMSAVAEAARAAGMDYTTSLDGTGVKFLHFGGDEGVKDFLSKAQGIAQAAGLPNVTPFEIRSTLNESQNYLSGGLREGFERTGSDGSAAGPSDLFRAAVDHLLAPYARAVAAEGYRLSPERLASRFGLSAEQRQVVAEALAPKNWRKRSTARILSGQEKLDVTATGKRGQVTNTDVMTALQNRAALDGLIDPTDRSEKTSTTIARVMADEVTGYMADPKNKEAVGWYDKALKAAKADYAQIFPDIKSNPDHELLFDALLGITSQGNDVFANSKYAARLYELTHQGLTLQQAVGVLRGSFGGKTVAIEGNLMKLAELIDRLGYDKLREEMNTRMSISAWNARLRKDPVLRLEDKPLKIEGQADQKVTGWFIFGPKIGSFINNLHGDYSTLTADLWFTRTWNRILGMMWRHTPEAESTQYQKFREEVINSHLYDAELGTLLADPDSMLALAEKIENEFRTSGYKNGTDLKRAAKTWVELRDVPIATPRGDTERAFQQRTVEQAQKMIERATGERLTIADIQAALWFHEKALYAKLGSGNERSAPADYAGASQRTMKQYRAGDLFLVDAGPMKGKYLFGKQGSYLSPKLSRKGITQDMFNPTRYVSPTPFYSALHEVVSTNPAKSLPAIGWKAAIKAAENKGQVRADEVFWSGVNDWLDAQQGKVSREAFERFIEDNGVKITDVTKSDADAEESGDADQGPKYESYKVSGGMDYKEMLLVLGRPSITMFSTNGDKPYGVAVGLKQHTFATMAERAAFMTQMQRRYGREFKSDHWDQRNVVAHTRFDTRIVDGQKTLFVQELQSDWAQTGRSEGFAPPGDRKELSIVEGPKEPTWVPEGTPEGTREWVFRATDGNEYSGYGMTEKDAREDVYNAIQSLTDLSGVPRGPFVDSTEKWLTLALKRLIRYAVDNGFERIAFANGEQNAANYGLEKVVSSIKWNAMDEGKRVTVRMKNTAGPVVLDINDEGKIVEADTYDGNFDAKQFENRMLAEAVGEEMAQKIMAAKTGSLAGDGLKVGGKGMLAFYDKIVPTTVNKLIGKIDGSKVSTIDMTPDWVDKWRVDTGTGEVQKFDTKAEALAYLDRIGETKDFLISPGGYDGPTKQLSFPLTDKLRESALGGFPLFSRTGIANPLKQLTVTDLKGRFTGKWADLRKVSLQLLGGRHIAEVYARDLPQLPEYQKLVQLMQAGVSKIEGEADKVATAWGRLKDERQLAELMHDSTLAQIDPAKPYVAGDVRSTYDELRARWDRLTPEAQAIYKQARDMYEEHYSQVREAIRERIERADISSPRKSELLTRMDGEFFDRIKGVYFPLARFGNYVVTVRDQTGKAVSVSREETYYAAQKLRQTLRQQFGPGYVISQVVKAEEFNARRDGVGREFLERLFNVLDETGIGQDLQDDVNQLVLNSMPDISWAKHGIHRKGTPGFSQNARRAFAQNMVHGARYLQRTRYGDRLERKLSEMQKYVSGRAELTDSVKAQQVLDEVEKRHDILMKPKTHPAAVLLNSFGYLFHLGLSPSTALVNLLQTPMVAGPILAGRWGGKALSRLTEASFETLRAKNDLSNVLKGDELKAFEQAVDEGVIDKTMAHDLAGIAQGEDDKMSWHARPIMRAASFLFHHAERFNRQATFIAAYRLAREAGAGHEQAFNQASDATIAAHFDYASSNRPRAMQGNWQRVILQFKQYSVNMLYLLGNNARLALKGDPVAAKTLAGLLVTTATAAGAIGLPFVAQILSLASMIGSSPDEPWDAEVALANYLSDTFGQKTAEVMLHGASRLTPFDISGRVNMDIYKMLFPDVNEAAEGADAYMQFVAGLSGPVIGGIGEGVARAMKYLSEGDTQRAMESLAPAAVRGPLIAWRYQQEGVKTRGGEPILQEVAPAGIAGQAFGLRPSQVANAMEGRGAILDMDRKLQQRRGELINQYAKAAMGGDDTSKALVEIAQFNAANPSRMIAPMHLSASVMTKERRNALSQQGVYLPLKRRDLLDVGRFAQEE